MTSDASGAFKAAMQGDVVVIVDVIDMSTSLEAAIEAGAFKVFGSCSDKVRPPVPVDPERIGFDAGSLAAKNRTAVIIIAEPRSGSYKDRENTCLSLLKGLEKADMKVLDIIPNIGMETANQADFKDKVVIAVTSSGGAAFDAAYNAGAEVFTATVARTLGKKGVETVRVGIQRVQEFALSFQKDISVVAASGNSLEDLLAAQYITNHMICFRAQK